MTDPLKMNCAHSADGWCLACVAAFAARMRAEAEKDAQRYRTVRRMNVAQFRDAFVLNIRTGKPFDEIVDEAAPFMDAAIRAQSNAGD